ncbi:MAG: glycosyltransferase [Xanthomonadaceae bacterium]|nr:glycosyltransferase [Rhodospirillaceae bacterium]NIA18111.1 glycosyltransferase [Xanthomonadaceae bacterium]
MNIFVIIPVFNEEKNIKAVIKDVKNEVPDSNIVVVDDCSNDNTIRVAKNQGIIVLKHIINRGQGAALQTGNKYAIQKKADIIVHFDGDGQHIAKDIKNIIQPIIDGEADIVLGSRFLSIKDRVPMTKKFFILKPALFFNFIFTGLRLSDAHNGLRAMSKKATLKIEITQDKMAHNTEIISKIKKNKLKYKEIPVNIVYNEYGQNFFDGLKIIKDLFAKKIL